MSAEQAIDFLADADLLAQAWTSLLSNSLLPVGCLQLLGMREKFVKAGAKEEVLPLNEHLQEQYAVFAASHDEIMGAF